jgi:formate hydrogenlyase transcriptional activator
LPSIKAPSYIGKKEGSRNPLSIHMGLSYCATDAERMNKQIDGIPADVMEVLVGHSWPGNIRELQNFIERSVILTDGDTLRPPLEGLQQQTSGINSPEPMTLEPEPVTLKEVERHHIRKALERANWVIGGASGAAVR